MSSYVYDKKFERNTMDLVGLLVIVECINEAIAFLCIKLVLGCPFSKEYIILWNAGYRKIRTELFLNLAPLDKVNANLVGSLVVKVGLAFQFRY